MFRYQVLQVREKAGRIKDLRLQPPYKLFAADLLITTYRADFEYTENGVLIIEDVKGQLQKDTEIKLRLMPANGHPAVRLLSLYRLKSGHVWKIQTGKKTRIKEENFDAEKDSGYVP